MNFNAFWKWLNKQGRIIVNLAEDTDREFAMKAEGLTGTCFPTKPHKTKPFKDGKVQQFGISQAKAVWDRFHSLPDAEKLMAGRYVSDHKPHNWKPCPQPMVCNPWIAAAIRDFLAGQK
ncbi:MAG: hypothetical protein WCK57_11650 [Verrucomicrobiae bacterium]